MQRVWCYSSFLALLLLSAACSNKIGKSGAALDAGAIGGADLATSLDAFEAELEVDYGTPTAVLALWQRGPGRDNDDLRVNSTYNLDLLNRKGVALYDLPSSNALLSNQYFQVVDSVSNRQSTSPSTWLNNPPPWKDSNAFKMLMAYAHLSRARKHLEIVMPELSFSNSQLSLLPLPVAAAEPGHPLETGYFANGGKGQIKMYLSADRSLPYGTSDESDAIIHEYGHVVQHALNKSILESPGNYDMDSLLEALADVFAASINRDDQMLDYLAANASLFFDDDRTGPQHKRGLRHSLSFPNSYLAHLHLDGRVVAGAFNDIRRLLQEGSVEILNCSSSCTELSPLPRLSKGQAFDFILKLSHKPLEELVQTSTLQRYAELVRSFAENGDDIQELCAARASCKTRFAEIVSRIFRGRGLLSSADRPQLARKLTYGAGQEIIVYSSPAILGVQGGSRANADTILNACEEVILAPFFKNNTSGNASVDMYDVNIKLVGLSGFREMPSSGSVVEALSGSRLQDKILGWISPGQDTRTLLRSSSSPWYRSQPLVGSQLTHFPAMGNLPSAVGWAVRAPSSGTASVTFELRLRPYNSRSNVSSLVTGLRFTQSLNVDTTSNFCGI